MVLLFFVVAVDVAIHAHSFAIICSVCMHALRCFAGTFPSKFVITVVAHALGVEDGVFVRTSCHDALFPT